MTSFNDKALTVMQGDIVSVSVGRGWRRAKVLANNDGILKIRFKGGKTSEVSAEYVLTSEEKQVFRKTGASTQILRNPTQEGVRSADTDSPENSKGI